MLGTVTVTESTPCFILLLIFYNYGTLIRAPAFVLVLLSVQTTKHQVTVSPATAGMTGNPEVLKKCLF